MMKIQLKIALETFNPDSKEWGDKDDVDSKKGGKLIRDVWIESFFKVVVLGDTCVGKTSVITRFVENKFDMCYPACMGVSVSNTSVKRSKRWTVKLQFWDLSAGHFCPSDFMSSAYCNPSGSMRGAIYKETGGCLVVADVTQRSSLQAAVRWKQDVDNRCTLGNGCPVPCLLLANKCDSSYREVTDKQLDDFCKEHEFFGWRGVSARNGTNVDEAMGFLIDEMVKQNCNLESWRLKTGNSAPSDGK